MERFLALLEKAPRRGTALDRVYGYHVERGTLDDLIKRYQDRTAGDPKDGAAWLLLGLFEAQRGHDAAAVAALRRAEAERPDDPLPAYYLGQALVLVGQPDAAAAAFERAMTRKPARSDLLEIFQALGRVYQRAHRNEQALEVWTRLEKLFPDDARVQEQIAATLAEESQHDQALVRYQALAKAARDPYRKVQFRIEAAEPRAPPGPLGGGARRLRGAPGRPRARELALSRGPPPDRGRLPPERRPGRPGALLRELAQEDARRRRGDGPARPHPRRRGPHGRGPALVRQGRSSSPRRARSCGWP